jgi:Domain of unknown function (DUF397)
MGIASSARSRGPGLGGGTFGRVSCLNSSRTVYLDVPVRPARSPGRPGSLWCDKPLVKGLSVTGSFAPRVAFKISSFCTVGGCVEVGTAADGSVLVRDSKDASGEPLAFTKAEWVAFVAGVKAGEFDIA